MPSNTMTDDLIVQLYIDDDTIAIALYDARAPPPLCGRLTGGSILTLPWPGGGGATGGGGKSWTLPWPGGGGRAY